MSNNEAKDVEYDPNAVQAIPTKVMDLINLQAELISIMEPMVKKIAGIHAIQKEYEDIPPEARETLAKIREFRRVHI
jgi:hypothetical protein